MRIKNRLYLIMSIVISIVSFQSAAANFVFLDEVVLESNRARLHSSQATSSMKQAYHRLIEEAELAMKEGPFSVTDKGMTPPSGTKHDYMSISPYWWPDTSKKDGLPWIRHDGKTNPASKTNETDSVRIGHFTRSVRALALAYYFSGDEKYAKQGIGYIETWFLNEATKMNPNVNFGQSVPGVAHGRRSGVIDTRTLTERTLDAIAILSLSPSWTNKHETQITQWYQDYLNWLLTNELSGGPKGEAYSPNNHGSWYDYQVASIAYFLNNKDLAQKMVEKGKMRIDTQFEKDGSQPHEAARTRSYHYHYFNLEALTGLAQIGEKVGVDLWRYESLKGASLTKGIQLMADYQDSHKKWLFPEKDKRRVERMASIYKKAGIALNKPEWIKLTAQIDFSHFTVNKNLAEIWVQRDLELLTP